ncbi:MAG TPA: hypothetical protein VHO94_01520 [Oscillospiraceae bacterium]|nr:hypothetical protein [Oscillospiraceae bacterium]
MKKIFSYFFLLVVLLTTMTSCSANKLETMKYDGNNSSYLLWGKNEYSCYGIISEDNEIGKQIGTVAGVSDSRVFEVKGQSPQCWLIVTNSDEMTIYSLYKEDSVSDIPSNLQKDKQ